MIANFTLSNIFAEIKKSSKIALPLIVYRIILDLSGFFATIIIADVSKKEFAAYALAWTTFSTLIAFFMGILAPTSILIAHSFGAKDISDIRKTLHQGLWLAVIFAPIMMALVWYGSTVLSWTKQDPTIIELATPAFHAFIWTILPSNIITVIMSFFMGTNKAHLVTITYVITIPIQILCFYIFLLGKLGFPQLGLQSIGYGLTISYYIVLIPLFFYIIYSKQFKIYQLCKNWAKLNIKILSELIRLGVPLGLYYLNGSALYAVIAIMMGKLGTNTLTAYQIYYQYLMLALMVLYALTQTATIRVGIEVGENNRHSLRSAAFVNIVIGLMLMTGFSICYIYFPQPIIALDSKAAASQEVDMDAAKFLLTAGILIILHCIRLTSAAALQGLKDIKIPMIITIICFWGIAIPCSYIFGFQFKFGGVGILWSIAVGTLLAASILLVRFNLLSKHINLKTLITRT